MHIFVGIFTYIFISKYTDSDIPNYTDKRLITMNQDKSSKKTDNKYFRSNKLNERRDFLTILKV